MNFTKCDICGKKIENNSVKAGIGFLGSKDFCLVCGKPVINFLKKHKLLKEDKIKK
jgi:hypothetical protein